MTSKSTVQQARQIQIAGWCWSIMFVVWVESSTTLCDKVNEFETFAWPCSRCLDQDKINMDNNKAQRMTPWWKHTRVKKILRMNLRLPKILLFCIQPSSTKYYYQVPRAKYQGYH
jgi:hypothetical protein